MKKHIKIFLAILLICLVGVVNILIIKNNRKLSIEEVKLLLDKGKDINNVYFEHTVIETNSKEYTMKKYWKDNIFVFEIEDTYQWINFDTNEWIYIDNTNDNITSNDTKNCNKFNDYSYYFKDLIEKEYEYKYIKTDDIGNIKCHVVEIKKENVGKVKFWINCENGVVEKFEEYNSIGELTSTNIYKYTYNIVTDENIMRPDFSKYESYTIVK